ncbi:hypothetical protein K2P56_02390 [Patescibacteria group bacterium]|nr:hypothetical protein [Patescibacteria group bacterium]
MSTERDRKRTRTRKTADQREPKITPVAASKILIEEAAFQIPITDAFSFPRCTPRELGPREGKDPAYIWSDGLSED